LHATVYRLYAWEGIDAAGVRQQGQQAGRSPAFVRAWLKRQGIRAIQVRPAWRRWRWPQPGQGGCAGVQPAVGDLADGGVPLLQAFEVMVRSNAGSGMSGLLVRLKQDVAAGLGLADALQRHPAWFDALYCNLVRVGEHAGTLDRQLEQMATMLEKRQALRQKVRKAMLYPALLLLTGLGVAALLLLEVVPRFRSLFASFDKALPAFTQWVIDLSTVLGNHAAWLVVLITALGLGTRELYRRHLPARLWLLRLALRVPVVGPLLGQAALARFARCLATSYGAGVALLDALQTVAPVSGDSLHERAILALRQGVANGLGLHQAMEVDALFPPLLRQLVAVGEASGTLDLMLDKAALHYEEQVSQGLEQLTTLLEPAIVLILGCWWGPGGGDVPTHFPVGQPDLNMNLWSLVVEHPPFFYSLAVVLGLLVGSFLNVLAYRLPIMLDRQWQREAQQVLGLPGAAHARFDLCLPASRCPHCQHQIRAWENIPVLSYLALRGRCSACKGASAALPLVELGCGLLSLLVAWHFGPGRGAAGHGADLGLARPEPHRCRAPVAAGCAGAAAVMAGADRQCLRAAVPLADAVWGAVAGYLSLWSVFWVFKLLTGKDGMGQGDFKLLALLGAWGGWQILPMTLMLGSLAGALIGLMLVRLRRAQMGVDAVRPLSGHCRLDCRALG
jgi:type IV pilus assembly protein PilC